MKENFHLKIYCLSEERILEWQGIDRNTLKITRDLKECLAQTYKIVIVDAFCDNPEYQHTFNSLFVNFNWEVVNLVIIKENLWESYEDIYKNFILKNKIKNFIVSSHNKNTHVNLYNPCWFLRPVNYSTIKEINNRSKKYMFEALMGSPRDHRFFLLAKLEQHKHILDSSVVTFRSEFLFDGQDINSVLKGINPRIKKLFRNKVTYPYVSPNMEDSWENVTGDNLNRKYFLDGIDIPWKVYENTWYSICTETELNDEFPTITEKTGKLFLAKRVFVMFGSKGTLQLLNELGFKTFNSIIDESYDLENDTITRFEKAFTQIEFLMTLDPVEVYKSMKEITEHNFNRMFEFRDELRNNANEVLLNLIPCEFIS